MHFRGRLQPRLKISILGHFKSENQDDFIFANLCNLKVSSPKHHSPSIGFPPVTCSCRSCSAPQIWSSPCSSPSSSSWDPEHLKLICKQSSDSRRCGTRKLQHVRSNFRHSPWPLRRVANWQENSIHFKIFSALLCETGIEKSGTS